MKRSEDTRAASLALELPPPLDAEMTVGTALARPSWQASGVGIVRRRGRTVGGLRRSRLEHAFAFGLGELRLGDLLVGDLQSVPPGASLARVRRALHAGVASFVVLRAPGKAPSGFIDRARLAELGLDATEWRNLPGRDADRIRASLRRRVSAMALEALEELGRRAAETGGRACLVGGVVRDLLLGRPTRDLDVIVEGRMRVLLRGLAVEKRIHSRFLTATLKLGDGTVLDVAHARSERYSRPAALPEVEASTVEADLARRDFTLNALAMSIEPGRFGAVLDRCGGVDDLRKGRIRVLHGLSFVDDPTRAFRAVRLAARLDCGIERRTVHAMELALERGVFGRLSSARLLREVRSLLDAPEVSRSLTLAERLGLLPVLNPKLECGSGARSRPARAADAVAWYEGLEREETIERWLVPLGVLLTDSRPRVADEIVERLGPGRRAARVLRCCRESVRELLARLSRRTRPSPSTVYRACAGLEVEILLMAVAAAPRRETRCAIRRHLEIQRGARLQITGRDLLRAGVPAGPAVARGLQAALEARLDGRAEGAAEQLRQALRAAKPGTDPA